MGLLGSCCEHQCTSPRGHRLRGRRQCSPGTVTCIAPHHHRPRFPCIHRRVHQRCTFSKFRHLVPWFPCRNLGICFRSVECRDHHLIHPSLRRKLVHQSRFVVDQRRGNT